MTNKEEAQKLVEKMFSNMPKYLQGKIGWETAKQCALICVDEWMESLRSLESSYMRNVRHSELKEVRQEIEKL